jgi:hypothetical protein
MNDPNLQDKISDWTSMFSGEHVGPGIVHEQTQLQLFLVTFDTSTERVIHGTSANGTESFHVSSSPSFSSQCTFMTVLWYLLRVMRYLLLEPTSFCVFTSSHLFKHTSFQFCRSTPVNHSPHTITVGYGPDFGLPC